MFNPIHIYIFIYSKHHNAIIKVSTHSSERLSNNGTNISKYPFFVIHYFVTNPQFKFVFFINTNI